MGYKAKLSNVGLITIEHNRPNYCHDKQMRRNVVILVYCTVKQLRYPGISIKEKANECAILYLCKAKIHKIADICSFDNIRSMFRSDAQRCPATCCCQ